MPEGAEGAEEADSDMVLNLTWVEKLPFEMNVRTEGEARAE